MEKLKSLRPGANKSSSSSGSSSRFSRDRLTNLKPVESMKGLIPGRSSSTSPDSVTSIGARPLNALRDPSTFAPPPKRDPNAAIPPLPRRVASGNDAPTDGTADSKKPPAIPPRLPPRTGSFPTPREVSDEEMRSTGGVNVSALNRLANAGIRVPGFESVNSNSSGGPPPPPPPLRTPASTSALGDRFGKLSIGSSRGNPEQGTTMEQKKQAAITANKFYKNPTSVSFKDAREAAGTARNFQQRHGDQVMSGLNAANKLGIIPPSTSKEKESPLPPIATARPGAGSPPLPAGTDTITPPISRTPLVPVRSGSVPPPLPVMERPGVVGKKPPPPLPPKKKPPPPAPKPKNIGDRTPPPPVPASSRPPPVPLSSRPALATPALPPPTTPYSLSYQPSSLPNLGLPAYLHPPTPPDLDLSLNKLWFTSSPPRLPDSITSPSYLPPLTSPPHMSSTSSWSTSSSGRKRHTLVLALLWPSNLSRTTIHLTWDAASPEHTVRAQQRHEPAPAPVVLDALPDAGEDVARWCEARMGQKVGDGECWTLASEALKATPGVMASVGYSHGACVYSHSLPDAPLSVDIIKRGDILQFWKARWSWPDGSWKTAGDPDHTAVVVGSGCGDGVLEVVEQNVGGKKEVMRGSYELATLKGGRVRVFRAASEEWGVCKAEWNE